MRFDQIGARFGHIRAQIELSPSGFGQTKRYLTKVGPDWTQSVLDLNTFSTKGPNLASIVGSRGPEFIRQVQGFVASEKLVRWGQSEVNALR